MRGLNKFLILGSAIVFSLFVNSGFAQSNSEQADSCGFISTLVSSGGKAGVQYLDNLAANSPMWSKSSRAKLGPALVGPMGRFSYQKGSAFVIADLGDITQEHLIAMQLTTGGTVYFRILYEWDGSKLSFINIKLQAGYYDIIKSGGITGYVPVSC